MDNKVDMAQLMNMLSKMDKKDLEILQQYIFDIEALVNVTCDSCEHNLYTAQQNSLEIARRYIWKINELLNS